MLKVVSPTAARRWLGTVNRRCCAQYTHRRFSLTMALTGAAPLGCRGYSDGPQLQFPPLPKEWAGRYKPGQMFSEQESLPHLPVPPLQQTLERYLNCVQPLLSEGDFQKTREFVREFGREGGAGEELQTLLHERAKTRDSWLLEWWNHVAYLGYRLPVIVYSNPAIGFPRQQCSTREQYVETAAWFTLGLVKWHMLIQNEAIPVDRYRGKPMCMHHYQLYSKCRIPGPTADTVRATPINESRHVLVIRNGHFYRLDVLYETADGVLAVCPPAHVITQLHRILDDAPPTNKHPVGILTNEHRDTWYKARERLREDPVNCASLDDIETAILSISLDKAHPNLENLHPEARFNDHQRSLVASNFLHGNGSQLNSTNRWSDMCIQVSLCEDGSLGSMLEHTGGDGPPAIAADIFLLSMQKLGHNVLAESSPVPTTLLKPARLLEWNISADSAQDIQTAIVNNDKLCNNVDLKIGIFDEFGKDVPKKFSLSPDGFIQTAIQLAFWKLYEKTTAMYESGATRWFKYGRTDTIRSVSNTSRRFLQAMSNPSVTAQEKVDLLVASVKAHSDYTNQAISGQAPDRHLLGMRLAASEVGMDPLPSIFTDPAYSKSLHFQLSTSQVPVADFDLILCFGAVVPDGYGVCYNPQQGKTLLGVTCYHSCPDTDSALFLDKLKESLREMRDVMEVVTPPTAKL